MTDAGPLVLLTRPRPASRRVADDLRAAIAVPYRVRIAPVLQILPVGPVPDLGNLAAVILTSENALGRLDAAPRGLTAYCVGDRTAEAAGALGFAPVSAGGDADALVARILADRPEGRLLHLRGETARGQVTERLQRAGLRAESLVVYAQSPRPLDPDVALDLARAPRIIAALYSPASAAALAETWPEGAVSPDLVAISRAAADAWQGPKRSSTQAETPDGRAMIAALGRAIRAVGPCP